MKEITGTRDQTYDLVSVLYHALQGAETYAKYIEDAEKGGDEELSAFFRQSLEQERERAQQAKALLKARLGRGQAQKDDSSRSPQDEVEAASMDSFPASDAPAHY